jgi:tyrosine-protein kinase Etk/Wzc
MEFQENDFKETAGADNAQKYILGVLRRWPYILTFLALALLAAFLFNRYATPVYQVKSRITTTKFSQQPYTPVPGVIDANFFLKGYTDVYEEIPLLKSRERIEEAVNMIDYQVSYFSKGLVKTNESAHGNGFDVQVDTILLNGYPAGIPIYVNQLDASTFNLNVESDRWATLNTPVYRYGQPITLGAAQVRIVKTNGLTLEKDKYFFTLNQKDDMVRDFQNRLVIDWALKGSAMLDLSMESEVPDRDVQFMNAFYEVVTLMGMRDKNQTLSNTIEFIDEQMNIINDSVLFYQNQVDQLKLKNVKLNLGTEYIFTKFADLDKRRAEIAMKESYLRYLETYFKTNNNPADVFAPSVMELNVPLLEDWVGRYIEQRLGEQVLKNAGNALNPLVTMQDSLKRKLIDGIYESIASTRLRNEEALKQIEQESVILYSSVKDVQLDFRELTQHQRLLQLNVSLFDLFLRRKTEAAISRASAASDYKIIDKPAYSRQPIFPDKLLNLLMAAVLGLVLPIGFFVVRDVTNTRITDKDELQKILSMPMLGSIPHSPYLNMPTIAQHPRSVVAESFRAIRANLKFVVPQQGQCITLMVTSSVAAEGKTFCSINMAQSLVLAKKKVLLIGADMRRPNFQNYITVNEGPGLSEFLAGLTSIDSIVHAGDSQLPDVIHAGVIPPNPTELLVTKRMEELMARLKEVYEYIIIDTAPIGLVADAMELLRYTDLNLFVVRQNVTHKGALRMIAELYNEGKIKNFAVVFNDMVIRKAFGSFGSYVYGMGYDGYGYGYYEEDNGKMKKKQKI